MRFQSLWRYAHGSLVPFMFALLLLEYLSRKLIFHLIPIVKTAAVPGSLMIAGLALSVWSRDDSRI